jgi:hypothetical protein
MRIVYPPGQPKALGGPLPVRIGHTRDSHAPNDGGTKYLRFGSLEKEVWPSQTVIAGAGKSDIAGV